MTSKIIEQQPFTERANAFLNRYGCKKQWLAEKTKIPVRTLSTWINGNCVLCPAMIERLIVFLDEYDTRMGDFEQIN